MPTADSQEPEARAELVWTALSTALELGDDAAALAARERLQPLLAGIQDPFLHAVSQLASAWVAPLVDDLDGALQGVSSCLEELREQDEPLWTALALGSLGFLETSIGRDDEAVRHVNEARDLAEQLDNPWLAAWSRAILARVAVSRSRLDEARALLGEALALSVGAHSTTIATFCLAAFARLALAEGDANRAALLIGSAEALRRGRGLRAWPILRRPEAELMAQIRQTLGPVPFDQAFADGSRLNLREAVALAGDRRNAVTQTR